MTILAILALTGLFAPITLASLAIGLSVLDGLTCRRRTAIPIRGEGQP